MAEHPIQGLMGVTMEKIREMVDADTIVGAPINAAEGVTILPISKVTFGFASGGSDIGSKTNKDLFGGGGGAGVSISPIAFLVIQNGNVRTIQLADHASTVDRALNMVPELVDKLSELLKKDKEEKPGGEATE
ncbi:sporulation protein YtfJ [Gemmiger sp. An120]|uniref:GerW family sporulation protein n=1 Tax=Gemmiger TaxID=204475 RepID=UPI000B37912F|nr:MULTISPECIES: GerW family sporulation protein [Gemmiger]MBM6916655.1 GerW family sporulation protein [Gemmiger formicilis]OUQ44387.1 sporulation protein YtfJ [Gemmiger sp. An120]HIX34588.1 GerW family sporulation protein [Candidatus Gemmiger avium]